MSLTLEEANRIIRGALANAQELGIKVSAAVCRRRWAADRAAAHGTGRSGPALMAVRAKLSLRPVVTRFEI